MNVHPMTFKQYVCWWKPNRADNTVQTAIEKAAHPNGRSVYDGEKKKALLEYFSDDEHVRIHEVMKRQPGIMSCYTVPALEDLRELVLSLCGDVEFLQSWMDCMYQAADADEAKKLQEIDDQLWALGAGPWKWE